MASNTGKKVEHTRAQVMEMVYNVRDCAWPADVKEYMTLIEPMLRAYAELLPDEHQPALEEKVTDIMVCELGDYAVPDARQWATVIMNDQKIAECYSNEGAQLVGAALRQYHCGDATRSRSDLVININNALQAVRAPDECSYTRAEYFKAGVRACIKAVGQAVRASIGDRP